MVGYGYNFGCTSDAEFLLEWGCALVADPAPNQIIFISIYLQGWKNCLVPNNSIFAYSRLFVCLFVCFYFDERELIAKLSSKPFSRLAARNSTEETDATRIINAEKFFDGQRGINAKTRTLSTCGFGKENPQTCQETFFEIMMKRLMFWVQLGSIQNVLIFRLLLKITVNRITKK